MTYVLVTNISFDILVPSFSYLDLSELTSNFNKSCKLGEGAFGSVFSGDLDFSTHSVCYM